MFGAVGTKEECTVSFSENSLALLKSQDRHSQVPEECVTVCVCAHTFTCDRRMKHGAGWVAYPRAQDSWVLFYFIPGTHHAYSSRLAYQEAQWAYGFEEITELGADRLSLASGQWQTLELGPPCPGPPWNSWHSSPWPPPHLVRSLRFPRPD